MESRISYKIMLFINGIFGMVAGACPNYIALISFATIWSTGAGKTSQPILLFFMVAFQLFPAHAAPYQYASRTESVPASHQYLLIV